MSAERRSSPRVPVRLLVQHQSQTDAAPELDYATDLSEGGLFIRTTRPATQNATIHVQFSPSKNSQLVDAFCRVARVTPDGMAAAFLRVDDATARALRTALE